MNIRASVSNPKVEPDVAAFARELSDLCRKHGIGITGTPALFVMERDDYQLNYKADANSNLVLT